MILLTSKYSENFENSAKENDSMVEAEQVKNCFDSCFSENCSIKMYNEEYIEVFSPTVFETVEVYTSSSSDKSEITADFNRNINFSEMDSDSNSTKINEINLNTIDSVNSLENLEPGTYTLDVLETTNFDFDAVFVDSSTNFITDMEMNKDENNFNENISGTDDEKMKKSEKKSFEESRKVYKLRHCKNSNRKPLSTKYSEKNVTAREFLNNFSNDLYKNDGSLLKTGYEDEGKSLSWLLDFKISSIFHPVENEIDGTEKAKKKLNDIQKKPRYTYTELIEQALKENGELTVSGIYNWISNHYPYYQQHDDRWKNSVRHNLSINPQFRKGKKASQGAGHFWNISDSGVHSSETNNIRVREFSQNLEKSNEKNKIVTNSVTALINQIDEEVLAATRSIQENENMDFTDVSLNDAAEQQFQSDSKQSETCFVNIIRSDIEHLWESAQDISDQRYHSFSPLVREITEESTNMEEENFLIQDIHNSICLGDELFANGLNSPYYGLTTI